MTSVIAHRGASGDAPENTLAAARIAVRHGADAVECDVHRTRDGALVVIHDRHVRRTTNGLAALPRRGRLRVAELTLDEIQRLDAGAWFDPAFVGERVPTLQEWAAEIGSAADLLVEMKRPSDYPSIQHDLAVELRTGALAAAVARRGVTVQSFDHAWLRRFREVVPDVPVGVLSEGRLGPELVELARGFAHHLNPALGAVDPSTVLRLRDAGLGVSVWTANTHRQLRRALACGVDGVITDRPARLRPLVAQRFPPESA
ncbi:MAG: glycerophosphodiester phosphodiesterase family protein [Nocardioidaceae bacterium]